MTDNSSGVTINFEHTLLLQIKEALLTYNNIGANKIFEVLDGNAFN
jgi:hypothetical protein